jgi:hypothetical protein
MDCPTLLLLPQRETDRRTTVKIAIATAGEHRSARAATSQPKDRYYRHSQQECNRSQDLLRRAQTIYRGSQKSLSPHERNHTRDRGNGPDRKKSTLPTSRQRRRDTVSRNRNHCPQQPTRGQPTVPESKHPTHADSVRWRGLLTIAGEHRSARATNNNQQLTTTYRNPRSGDAATMAGSQFVQADSHKQW